MESTGAQKTAADLSAEETAYDRGYDDGFAARDKLGRFPTDNESLNQALAGPTFKARVIAVLREVGLLGNI